MRREKTDRERRRRGEVRRWIRLFPIPFSHYRNKAIVKLWESEREEEDDEKEGREGEEDDDASLISTGI